MTSTMISTLARMWSPATAAQPESANAESLRLSLAPAHAEALKSPLCAKSDSARISPTCR